MSRIYETFKARLRAEHGEPQSTALNRIAAEHIKQLYMRDKRNKKRRPK